MAPECFGAERNGREDLGQRSSVRVSMVITVPVNPEGSKGVKGH